MEVNLRGNSFQSGGRCGRIEISRTRINLLGCIQGIYTFHVYVSAVSSGIVTKFKTGHKYKPAHY